MRAQRLAAVAMSLQAASGSSAPFSLAFVTDRRRVPHPELVARALPKGAAIVYRDYDDPRRAARAAMLRVIAAARGVFFLVGGDFDLARRLDADGVHLRADDLRRDAFPGMNVAPAGRAGKPDLSRRLILSAACHCADDLVRAAAIGADIALLSPVFPTLSHPGAPALGAQAFKRLAAEATLPVLALGGVDHLKAARLAGANVAGLAAIGAFYG